jgi:6-phosphofructokinase
MDIVHQVCDTIVERSNQGKDYGSILIPEGLLSHISSYRNLIQELNELFSHCTNEIEQQDLSSKLWKDETQIKQLLSPWSYSLYATLPDFMRL